MRFHQFPSTYRLQDQPNVTFCKLECNQYLLSDNQLVIYRSSSGSYSCINFVFTIIQPLALVQGKKVAEPKAKAAFDAAEHARPQASTNNTVTVCSTKTDKEAI